MKPSPFTDIGNVYRENAMNIQKLLELSNVAEYKNQVCN